MPERELTRQELIQAILCLIPDASEEHLKTRTVAQLRETLRRWRKIDTTSQREIDRHCDTGFIS